uniref:Uncharacterized protein n=1 Tax=Globisporangium ultimum (strain ATCC 200006 / CBS 805.95 / DAOM BR144) TaxID=431595 RepID=K3XAL2_GLOUD
MTMTTMPETDAGYDIVSSVKANSAVRDDDASSSISEHANDLRGSTRTAHSKRLRKSSDGSSSKEPFVFKANDDLEVRSLNFQDLLTARTLRPDSSADGDKAGSSSKQKPKPSPSRTPRPTPSTIKAESLSFSADDAVAEAIQSATPTPVPVVVTVLPTPVPVTVAPAPTVTVTPVLAVVPTLTPKVTPTPVRTRAPVSTATPPPVQTTEPITLPESPNKQDELSSTSSASKGSLATDQLVNNSTVKSGLNPTGFDDSIIVIILGGVGAIAVVVLVMSKKISKETGDDEALRDRSSFGVMRI